MTGRWPRLNESVPRILSSRPAPTPPTVPMDRTPGMRPSRAWLKLESGVTSAMSVTFSDAADVPSLRRSTAPAVPVTISSSMATAEISRANSTVAAPPAGTLTSWVSVPYPT